MSTSPLPPDPYEALGVTKDCDADAVKKAHRKLVLKHHPDRIKDPALVEQGKNEFQKVQQAYELLIDPVKRQRYDNQVKLAQLRKERMMNDRMNEQMNDRMNDRMSEREPPRPAMYTRTTYAPPPRTAPAPTHSAQMKPEPRYAFEERTPESYLDPRYEEPSLRTTARKDPFEKRPSASKPTEKRKEEKKATGWDRPAAGMSMKMAFGMKEKAQSAKQKVNQKETHAKNAKARDKEERRDRSEKQTYTQYARPQVEDYSSESSDSDTVVAAPRRGSAARPRSPRPIPRSYSPEPISRARSPRPMPPRSRTPEPMSHARSPRPAAARERSPQPRAFPIPSGEPQRRRQPSPQPSSVSYESDSGDEWKRRHQFAGAYIAKSRSEVPQTAARPPLSRQGSESHYWSGAADAAKDHRRSGSDSDKTRPTSSHKHPRRSMPPESAETSRRPPLHHGTSAPAGVKAAARTLEREPPVPRSRQGSYDSRTPNHRAGIFTDIPPLQRTSSDPVSPRMNTGTKRDSAPVKGSTLKESHTHQHDSGYGSSSNPHTPEMRGDSPPRPRETTTKFKVRKDEDEVHRARKMTDDGGDIHKFLSPESAETPYHGKEEKRERRSSRSRDPEPRKKSPDGRRHSPEPPHARSSRAGASERRPSFSRAESSSRYEEPRSRKVAVERSPERSYQRGIDPKTVKYASHAKPVFASHDGRHVEAAFHRTMPRERSKIPGYG